MTKIGIIGLGYVGGAVKKWFESQKGCELFVYDKFKEIGSVEEVNSADILFVCVPTPFHEDGGGYDDSAVTESLGAIQDGKTVVIKSTILPGSTDRFQKEHPNKTILFNPEFLRAKTANEDYIQPDTQIVGYANEMGKEKAAEVLKLLPKAPYERIVHATEAELVKYFKNTFFATKVIFANQIYDVCKSLGNADYEVVKECATKDPRIADSFLNVLADGYRGFGGGCLPKDTEALIQHGDKVGVNLELLKSASAVNKKLRDTT
jgi:UDPglucose 6-dehydrogenase